MTDVAAKGARVNLRRGLVRLLIVGVVGYSAAASFAALQAYGEAQLAPWFEPGRIRGAASTAPSDRVGRGTFAYREAITGGYSDTEIAEHLSRERAFDLLAARRAGLSDREIAVGLAALPISTADKLKSDAKRRAGAGAAARTLAMWGAVLVAFASLIAAARWVLSGFADKAARPG